VANSTKHDKISVHHEKSTGQSVKILSDRLRSIDISRKNRYHQKDKPNEGGFNFIGWMLRIQSKSTLYGGFTPQKL
jgi:hypothetical protein